MRTLAPFRAIFDEHFAYVFGALRRLGVPEGEAEDLTHEVFLNVLRKLDDYDPGRPLKPWLFGFVYRVAAHARRRAHRRPEPQADVDRTADPSPRADELLEAHQARELLLRALDELPIERRAVLVLHEWDGESIPEVARALGIPVNTAYSRLRVGREELASAVKRLGKKRERA